MSKEELTTAQKERRASKVVHTLPLIWLAYGAFLPFVYAFVGDTPYFLVAAYIVTAVAFRKGFAKSQARHTTMYQRGLTVTDNCVRCRANTRRAKGDTVIARFFRWYFHRRIIDQKATTIILYGSIVIAVIYESLGKPHAELLFLIGLEVFILQIIVSARSRVIHRAYEGGCPSCAKGDNPFPFGKVTEAEIKD